MEAPCDLVPRLRQVQVTPRDREPVKREADILSDPGHGVEQHSRDAQPRASAVSGDIHHLIQVGFPNSGGVLVLSAGSGELGLNDEHLTARADACVRLQNRKDP